MWLILQDQICRENTTWKVWTGRKKNKSPFLCIYVNVDVGNQHKNQNPFPRTTKTRLRLSFILSSKYFKSLKFKIFT